MSSLWKLSWCASQDKTWEDLIQGAEWLNCFHQNVARVSPLVCWVVCWTVSCGLGLSMTPFKTSRLLGRSQELHFLDILSLVDPGARQGALQRDMEARGKTPGFCEGSSSREEPQKGGSRQSSEEIKSSLIHATDSSSGKPAPVLLPAIHGLPTWKAEAALFPA